MRVLITWSSKRGGTEGIARILAECLRQQGLQVELVSAAAAPTVSEFDAALLGGALYAGRWPKDMRRFVRRHEKKLRQVPVWFFSSGPLDDTADHRVIPPPRQVQVLMDDVGAQGHRTFGGRLLPDAKGFPAHAMAKHHSGDWRNVEAIRTWAAEIAQKLPNARPRAARTPPGGSIGRLALHAAAGWALCAATIQILLTTVDIRMAIIGHAIAAPIIFTIVAGHYFRLDGARDPFPTAIAFVLGVVLLDLLFVAGLAHGGLQMFGSIAGTWLPLGLVLLATWAVGEITSVISSASRHNC